MTITVCFYAQLRDFFGESLSLELPSASTVQTIFEVLRNKNPLAGDWLTVSRAAGEDAFLAADTLLAHGQTYYLLPPSSGG